MFPLADARGPGAGLRRARWRDDQRPKYLNTSRTTVYHKGRQLFGVDLARGPARARRARRGGRGLHGRARAAPGRRARTVAIMGTALTEEQVGELGRAGADVYCALDADAAGQEAMARARGRRGRGLELRVVPLPDGQRPADLVQRGRRRGVRELLEGGDLGPGVRGQAAAGRRRPDHRAGATKALSAVVPVIRSVPRNSATWDELVRYVADRLDLIPQYLMTLLALPPPPGAAPRRRPSGSASSTAGYHPEAAASAERAFLAMCLATAETGQAVPRRSMTTTSPPSSAARAR